MDMYISSLGTLLLRNFATPLGPWLAFGVWLAFATFCGFWLAFATFCGFWLAFGRRLTFFEGPETPDGASVTTPQRRFETLPTGDARLSGSRFLDALKETFGGAINGIQELIQARIAKVRRHGIIMSGKFAFRFHLGARLTFLLRCSFLLCCFFALSLRVARPSASGNL